MTPWLIEKILGPDTGPYPPSREVWPSPDERHAAVVVDIDEIRMCYYIGKPLVVAGPPDEPRVIWRGPASLWCEPQVAWLSESQLAYRLWVQGPGEEQSRSCFLVLDLVRESLCFVLTPSFGANAVTIHPADRPDVWRLHVVPNEKVVAAWDINVSAHAMVWRPWDDVDGAKHATLSQTSPRDPGWDAREQRYRAEELAQRRQWRIPNPPFTVAMLVMWLLQPLWALILAVGLLMMAPTFLRTPEGVLAITALASLPACVGLAVFAALLWRGGATVVEKRHILVTSSLSAVWFLWPAVWFLVLRIGFGIAS